MVSWEATASAVESIQLIAKTINCTDAAQVIKRVDADNVAPHGWLGMHKIRQKILHIFTIWAAKFPHPTTLIFTGFKAQRLFRLRSVKIIDESSRLQLHSSRG